MALSNYQCLVGEYMVVALKRAIAVMKYENQPQIARPLGQYLGEAWLLNLPTSRCDS